MLDSEKNKWHICIFKFFSHKTNPFINVAVSDELSLTKRVFLLAHSRNTYLIHTENNAIAFLKFLIWISWFYFYFCFLEHLHILWHFITVVRKRLLLFVSTTPFCFKFYNRLVSKYLMKRLIGCVDMIHHLKWHGTYQINNKIYLL